MNPACLEKLMRLLLTVLLTLITVFPAAATAETRYVSDLLIITMRAEPEKDAEVIQALRSDTPVEVLEETEEFSKVRTESGAEGWVGSRYLTTNIPKSMIITELGEKINTLEVNLETAVKEKDQLADELEEIRTQKNDKIGDYRSTIDQERKEAREIKTEFKSLTKKYDQLVSQSKNVIQMAEKIKSLENENIQLRVAEKECSRITQGLEDEKKELFRRAIIRWFIAGGAVLLTGIILGRFSRKKDYY